MSCVSRVTCLLAALLLAPGARAAEPGAPAPVRRERLDAVLEAAGAAQGFAGQVLVGQGGEVAYERVSGLADRSRKVPHRAGALWPWASVTKQVTALLVMQEVEAGRLDLDTPVRSYLPDFTGPTADAVTLRHLLQHTSGLPNPDDTRSRPEDVPAFYLQRGRGVTARAVAAGGHCAGAPLNPPGKAFAYNNCDYLLLQAVLERATGKPYAQLVRERVARPSRAAGLRLAADGEGGVAGYTAAGARTPAFNLATYGAAGGLVGPARALLAFDAALLDRRLVSEATTAAMWKGEPAWGYAALGAWAFPARLPGGEGMVSLVERRGAIGGVQVRNVLAPALGRSVIVFTNAADVDFGEVWQGRGLTFDLLQAALCGCPAAK